jgi:putative two-component system response regulator
MQNSRAVLGKITVLIVDDTAVNRKVVSYALSECNLLEAADGESALGLLETHQDEIDVILLDIMMPRISGFEICQKIKAHPRWRMIPVIMLTVLTDVESRVNALQAGADDFISKPFDVVELSARVYNSARVKYYNDQLEDTKSILYTLASMVECKDPYTNDHLQRLEKITVSFCNLLGLSPEEQEIVRYAGMLHDIGKVGISDTILLKPGRLTPEEYEIVKTHTLIGYNIVKSLRMGKQLGPIVRGHHERWNGEGYPDGLKETEIPLGARIIGICDVFDALTSDRPYRKSISYLDALWYIQNQSGLHFDPDLVCVFNRLIQDFL